MNFVACDDDKDDNSSKEQSNSGKQTGSDDQKTSSDDQKTSSDDQKTGSDDQKTGSDDQKTGSDDQKTGSDDQKTGSDDQKTGSDDQKTGSDDEKTGSDDEKTGSDDLSGKDCTEDVCHGQVAYECRDNKYFKVYTCDGVKEVCAKERTTIGGEPFEFVGCAEPCREADADKDKWVCNDSDGFVTNDHYKCVKSLDGVYVYSAQEDYMVCDSCSDTEGVDCYDPEDEEFDIDISCQDENTIVFGSGENAFSMSCAEYVDSDTATCQVRTDGYVDCVEACEAGTPNVYYCEEDYLDESVQWLSTVACVKAKNGKYYQFWNENEDKECASSCDAQTGACK